MATHRACGARPVRGARGLAARAARCARGWAGRRAARAADRAAGRTSCRAADRAAERPDSREPAMSAHPLDRPVWTALATRQASFAAGGERARRFAPDIGPLAGARDDEPASLAELAALVPHDGSLLLLQAEPIVLPPGIVETTTAAGVQMVATTLAREAAASERGIARLAEEDASAML